MTPFEVLGLPMQFDIDARNLERAWLDRSRAVHPDRFAGKPDKERREAAQQTVALNDAYAAIKDPFDRAVWLVTNAGEKLAGLDQPLLVEMMELRERAEESATEKAAVVAECSARFAALRASLDGQLKVLDDTVSIKRAARSLAEMKTLARLVADLGGAALISGLDRR